MNVELRPMRVGEILDRAIQMLRANLGLFLGIAVFPCLANLGFSLSMQYMRGGAGSIGSGIAVILLAVVFWVAYVMLLAIAGGAKCWAASQLVMGRPVTVRSAYGRFKGRKGRLVGLGFLQGILSFWPAIPVGMVLGIVLTIVAVKSGVMPGESSSVLTVVAIGLLLTLACAPLYARYLLAFPVTAVHDLDVNASLHRSVELGRGFRWKVFWGYALPVGIGMVVAGGTGGLISLLQSWHVIATPQSAEAIFFWSVMGQLETFAVNLVTGPLASIALTLTYYDLCVRKEGLDVALLMEQAGMEVTPALAGEAASVVGEQPV